jgi:hypothetical protein
MMRSCRYGPGTTICADAPFTSRCCISAGSQISTARNAGKPVTERPERPA